MGSIHRTWKWNWQVCKVKERKLLVDQPTNQPTDRQQQSNIICPPFLIPGWKYNSVRLNLEEGYKNIEAIRHIKTFWDLWKPYFHSVYCHNICLKMAFETFYHLLILNLYCCELKLVYIIKLSLTQYKNFKCTCIF